MLFALLMLFMGGRIIAAAAAGQFHRQGVIPWRRVQPRLEAGLIVAMATAIVLAPFPSVRLATATAAFIAGATAFVRVLRWRLWATRRRPDLWCLGIGYAWIALGLLIFADAYFAGFALTTALHALTIGALGTLTLNVMVRVRLVHARLDPAGARAPVIGTVLITIAATARLMAGVAAADRNDLLLVAAACWSVAFIALLVLIIHARRQ